MEGKLLPRANYQSVAEPQDWQTLKQKLLWPEQVDYELLRPVLVLGRSPKRRAAETGVATRTIQRKLRNFRQLGMFSLGPTPLTGPGVKDPLTPLAATPRSRRRLPVSEEVRAYISQLKAQYPPFRPQELVEIAYARFGYRLSHHTVKRLLAEEPSGSSLSTLASPARRFPPYTQMPQGTERRRAVVTLYTEGWNPKTIGAYLQMPRSIVYDTLNRFLAEGVAGLENKSHARTDGPRKVDLATLELIRQLHANPELGEFRIYAALKDLGINLSPRTCGYVLARLRAMEAEAELETKEPKEEPKQFPYYGERAHQYWTVDLRYIETHNLGGGPFYVISILDNYSRVILASAIFQSQDLASFLIVLYAAVQKYGVPENLISDRGSIFLAEQAKLIYQKLGITKVEYERRQPWQSLIETNFNLQRRLADHGWSTVASWPQAQQVHAEWMRQHNQQVHWGHRDRADGKRTPMQVLGDSKGRRAELEENELLALFQSTVTKRQIDRVGYVKFRHWRFYAEIGLLALPGIKHLTRLWLHENDLRIEYSGKALVQYQVSYEPDQKNFKEIELVRIYDNHLPALQPMLFSHDWVKWRYIFDCRRPKLPSPASPHPPLAEQLVLPTFQSA